MKLQKKQKLALVALIGARAVLAQNDTYTLLFNHGVPVRATRTNNHGVSVGAFQLSGFLLKDDQYTLFAVPCATPLTTPSLADINDAGDVVGECTKFPAPFEVGFLRKSSGAFTILQVPGEGRTTPSGLNNGGVIVGAVALANPTPTLRTQPFLFKNGEYTKVTVPGAINAGLTDINDFGDAIGQAETQIFPQQGFPFLYRNGSIIPLPQYPGSDITLVTGINNRGEIVGVALKNAPTGQTATYFILRNGQFETFGIPGVLVFPHGINDKGEVTGTYSGVNGEGTSFIRRPK
jgi:hypothetical protein